MSRGEQEWHASGCVPLSIQISLEVLLASVRRSMQPRDTVSVAVSYHSMWKSCLERMCTRPVSCIERCTCLDCLVVSNSRDSARARTPSHPRCVHVYESHCCSRGRGVALFLSQLYSTGKSAPAIPPTQAEVIPAPLRTRCVVTGREACGRVRDNWWGSGAWEESFP